MEQTLGMVANDQIKQVMNVEAIEYDSIRGKKTYYLRFKKGRNEYIINVGKGTFDNINKLQNGEPTDGNVEASEEKPLDNLQEGGSNALDNKGGQRGRRNGGVAN